MKTGKLAKLREEAKSDLATPTRTGPSNRSFLSSSRKLSSMNSSPSPLQSPHLRSISTEFVSPSILSPNDISFDSISSTQSVYEDNPVSSTMPFRALLYDSEIFFNKRSIISGLDCQVIVSRRKTFLLVEAFEEFLCELYVLKVRIPPSWFKQSIKKKESYCETMVGYLGFRTNSNVLSSTSSFIQPSPNRNSLLMSGDEGSPQPLLPIPTDFNQSSSHNLSPGLPLPAIQISESFSSPTPPRYMKETGKTISRKLFLLPTFKVTGFMKQGGGGGTKSKASSKQKISAPKIHQEKFTLGLMRDLYLSVHKTRERLVLVISDPSTKCDEVVDVSSHSISLLLTFNISNGARFKMKDMPKKEFKDVIRASRTLTSLLQLRRIVDGGKRVFEVTIPDQVKQQLDDHDEEVESIIICQSIIRMHQSILLLMALKMEHSCAVVIQLSFLRYWSFILLKKKKYERKCILKLQAWFRGYLVRKDVKAVMRRMKASTTIEKLILSVVSYQRFICSLQRIKASRTIHRYCVAYVIHRNLQFILLRIHSSIIIQTHWRSYICRKEFGLVIESRNKSAALIQAQVRGNKNFKRFQAMKSSSLKLQMCWRMWIARSRLLEMVFMKYFAIGNQRIVRGFLARMLLKRLIREKLEDKSALIIQTCWRGCLGRNVRWELECEKRRDKSALIIQTCWRGCLGRNVRWELECEKRRERSALIIQTCWRGCLGRNVRWELECEKRRDKSALIIQTCWRYHVTMKKLWEIIMTIENESFLDYFSNSILIKSIQDLHMEFELSVLSLQTIYRRKKALKDVQNYRLRNKSSLIIQLLVRRFQARKKFSNMKKGERSAIIIQCALRCYHSKQILNARKKKVTCVVFLRSLIRMKQAIRYLKQLKLERDSSIKICRAGRKFLAQRILKQLKLEDKSARLIQEVSIQFLMNLYKKRLIRMRKSTLLLQRTSRGFVGRCKARKLKYRRNCVIQLQSWWRMVMWRKWALAWMQYYREERSSLDIQRLLCFSF